MVHVGRASFDSRLLQRFWVLYVAHGYALLIAPSETIFLSVSNSPSVLILFPFRVLAIGWPDGDGCVTRLVAQSRLS